MRKKGKDGGTAETNNDCAKDRRQIRGDKMVDPTSTLFKDITPVFCKAEMVDISSLIPNPANPNIHPKEQLQILGQVLQRNGWRSPIVVSKRSGYVVKGHGRLQAAQALGETKVPVEYQDYSSEELELADLIADNKLAEYSYMDALGLGDLLRKMSKPQQDLTGYSEDEILPLLLAEYSKPESNDSVPRILESLRVTKAEKNFIIKTAQKYCIKISKELPLGEVVAAICSEWSGVKFEPEKGEIQQPLRDIKPIPTPTPAEPAKISELSAESKRRFKIERFARTILDGQEVVIIRPSNSEEKFYTNEPEIIEIAREAKNAETPYKLLAVLTLVNSNLWIKSLTREAD